MPLLDADVTRLTPDLLDQLGDVPLAAGFDAVICTLGLTVIPDWRNAWQTMLNLVHPGGRIAIMDAGYPARGARPARPWRSGRSPGSCARRSPPTLAVRGWRLVAKDTDNVVEERDTLGYIGVAAGTRRPGADQRGTPTGAARAAAAPPSRSPRGGR
jgi:SAM-dependent methyltransferase